MLNINNQFFYFSSANVLYEHRPEISPPASKPSTSKSNLPNSKDNLSDILQSKRNALKVSSVSSLSNLLALDDQRSTSNLINQDDNLSLKSNTLPGILSNNSNNSSRCAIYNVNFSKPDEGSVSNSSLDKHHQDAL